jgi:hypothetical protein
VLPVGCATGNLSIFWRYRLVNQRPSPSVRFVAARFHQRLDSSATMAFAPAVVMTANPPTSL